MKQISYSFFVSFMAEQYPQQVERNLRCNSDEGEFDVSLIHILKFTNREQGCGRKVIKVSSQGGKLK